MKAMLQTELVTIMIAFIVTTFATLVVYSVRSRGYRVYQEVKKNLQPNPETTKIQLHRIELKNVDELRAAVLEFKGRWGSEFNELNEKLSAAKESIRKLMEELEDACK
ncbi:MAG: hypothetical protein B9J98_08035 [Candidatus Terraquivivens tikiterensis]|uniref:Uncharacterized protein n=1 Tax=Candidatus Terraquivivens tikiterensis TaxID=1980982 RepID=A0A2R7Y0I0_9ARCH|nr:MAG: hypothetical protein B9J98_08035 [Candidatus Terraquivivens tikiterensis]